MTQNYPCARGFPKNSCRSCRWSGYTQASLHSITLGTSSSTSASTPSAPRFRLWVALHRACRMRPGAVELDVLHTDGFTHHDHFIHACFRRRIRQVVTVVTKISLSSPAPLSLLLLRRHTDIYPFSSTSCGSRSAVLHCRLHSERPCC